MNSRFLSAAVLALFGVPCVGGQMICGVGSEMRSAPNANFTVPAASVGCDRSNVNGGDVTSAVRQPMTEIPNRAELLRRIGLYEAALRAPGVAHTSGEIVAKAYERLASLYENAGMNERAEATLKHSISLSRSSKEWSGQLAVGLSALGSLHAEQGKLHEAEKEQLEALSIRESLGGQLEIARSWSSLSRLYFQEHKYEVSRNFAQRAMDEFAADDGTNVVDRITSRLYLSMAMCYSKDCPAAVPVLKEAIEMAKSSFKPTDFPVGEGEFLLGFAYWKSGEIDRASASMEEGTAIMREQLGWGHPTYLNALAHYARFLRDSRRKGEAEVVAQQIRKAEAVVDVRSLPVRGGVDSLAGLR